MHLISKATGYVYMRPGRCQTRMKIKIISICTSDRFENHISFDLFPMPAIVGFYRALSIMCSSEAESAAKTSLKCICVHI